MNHHGQISEFVGFYAVGYEDPRLPPGEHTVIYASDHIKVLSVREKDLTEADRTALGLPPACAKNVYGSLEECLHDFPEAARFEDWILQREAPRLLLWSGSIYCGFPGGVLAGGAGESC